MATQICTTCGGAGTITDYNSKKMVSPSYYAYDQKLCYNCSGTGSVWVKDVPSRYNPEPVKKQPKSIAKNTSVKKNSSSNSSITLKGFFTFIGFILGAVTGFQLSAGNWVTTLIVAAIVAGITRVMYKIIIVLSILVILYLVYVGQ